MSKNRLLCILMATVICFSQIMEVRANLSRGRSQQVGFVTMRTPERDIFVHGTGGVIVNISGQRSEKNSCSFIMPMVEKIIFTVVTFLLGKLMFKVIEVLKIWAGDKLSQSFKEGQNLSYIS
ncbi:hypothetical protein [Bartonella tribocorum]|uniref:Uncharacterized protein n=1 Tax=Bartonella tribocorum TaxID=85701 RepID=A0A2M6UR27_9HYPH|nr:hypothetical protein [Bartonella tribocorum]PIT68631.1 hypothetical protein CEV08_07720 [Bartonella tribocorum]